MNAYIEFVNRVFCESQGLYKNSFLMKNDDKMMTKYISFY